MSSSILPMVVLVAAPAKAERLRHIEDLKGALIGVSGFGTPQHQISATSSSDTDLQKKT